MFCGALRWGATSIPEAFGPGAAAAGLARLHRRIRCQRLGCLHQAPTDLAKSKSVIVVEDLSVRGMIRHRRLSRSIAAAGWGAFRRMLEYKTQGYGSRLVVAPRLHASTKTCAACGHAQTEIPLRARVFQGAACGAALVVGSSPETPEACGGEGTGRENSPVQPAVAQQEPLSRQPPAGAAGNNRL